MTDKYPRYPDLIEGKFVAILIFILDIVIQIFDLMIEILLLYQQLYFLSLNYNNPNIFNALKLDF